MLELLATVDPMAALMAGLWLFAAGMFPVGFLLPCGPCCGCNGGAANCETNGDCASGCKCVEGRCVRSCGLCDGDQLPETVTVSFSDLPEQTPGPDLITIDFFSNFGGGASAKVTSPGGYPETDKGPISGVELTSGGAYGSFAKPGRVAPTVTAGGGSGTGATLAPSLEKIKDGVGIDYWKVTSVSVSGGTGYADGDQVTFNVAEGDTEATAASATIHTTRNEPTLAASASGGTGATFSIAYTKNAGPPETWSISSISVTNGGTGYSGGSSLNISLGTDDVEVYGTYAYITTSRTQPTVSAGVSGTGSGASLSVTLSSGYGDEYGPTWTVSSIGITNGGSGYSEWDQVTITVTDGQQSYWGYFDAYVTGVDEDGVITAITIYYGGDYYKDAGVITGVSLYDGGEYYKDDGVPTSVSVEGGGVYYREDPGSDPYVATVTAVVGSQRLPSAGSGATFSVEIDTSPSSETFGQVTSISIDEGGDGYLAWEWKNTKCCDWYWSDKSVVLRGNGCAYTHAMCGGWNNRGAKGRVSVSYNGRHTPPTVTLVTEACDSAGCADQCDTIFVANEAEEYPCAEFSFEATASNGATASVSAGGTYDPEYRSGWCHPCCQGEEPLPTEIVASLESASGYWNGRAPSGDYVLGYNGYYGTWGYSNRVGDSIFTISLSLGLCDEHCDECIKKCKVTAFCGIENLPRTRFNPPERDMRECPLLKMEYESQEYLDAICEGYCTITAPKCRPTGTFSFYQPSLSDNWSDFLGPEGWCDENTEPQIIWNEDGSVTELPPRQHLNVFVLTVADD